MRLTLFDERPLFLYKLSKIPVHKSRVLIQERKSIIYTFWNYVPNDYDFTHWFGLPIKDHQMATTRYKPVKRMALYIQNIIIITIVNELRSPIQKVTIIPTWVATLLFFKKKKNRKSLFISSKCVIIHEVPASEEIKSWTACGLFTELKSFHVESRCAGRGPLSPVINLSNRPLFLSISFLFFNGNVTMQMSTKSGKAKLMSSPFFSWILK